MLEGAVGGYQTFQRHITDGSKAAARLDEQEKANKIYPLITLIKLGKVSSIAQPGEPKG
jgi:hypothetical protein